jgi:hypothetical protein
MLGHADLYLCEFSRGIEAGEAAAIAAARVGHYRAESIAHRAVLSCALEVGELDKAKKHFSQSRSIIGSHQLRRFEPVNLVFEAAFLSREGRKLDATAVLQKALEICRETGEAFVGPWVCGYLAMIIEDRAQLRSLLSDGERVLESGTVGHNQLWFYRCAIEASLRAEEWDEADRYAAAMENYTRDEPLPWSDYFIAMGRALAKWGKGRREHEMRVELERLRGEAVRLNLRTVIPTVDNALKIA